MTGDQEDAHGVGGTAAYPSQKLYPGVPYESSDFHSTCSVENYQDAENVSDTRFNACYDEKILSSFKTTADPRKKYSIGAV
jgi:hypothetical protein